VIVPLRPENAADKQGIYEVHAASFPTALEARLVDALREAQRLTVSLVAIDDGRVVGHVAFSPVTVAGRARGAGLGPVAVQPAFRRRGIADRLIRDGLRRSQELGYDFAVVLGEPHYYARFGFVPAGSYGLRDEFGGGDAFQVLELRPGGVPRDAGVVRYAPEFDVAKDEE
jgi:putative acetyltransferase